MNRSHNKIQRKHSEIILLSECLWMSQPFMTGCDESGWHRVLGEPAELTVLSHRSLLAQSGFVFHYSEIECFHAYWSDPLIETFALFYDSEVVCILLKISHPILYFCYTYFISSWNQAANLTGKWLLIFMTVRLISVSHRHWDAAVGLVHQNFNFMLIDN